MSRFFGGGMRVPHHKGATAPLSIRSCPLPDEITLPMQQHIGAPCVPCVAVGDVVLRGQKIAEAQGHVSAPIHASLSGTVTALQTRPWSGGASVPCVIIQSDGRDEAAEPMPPLAIDAPAGELLARIKEAGLAGMGGAAFPTHVKLSPPPDKRVDVLIINGAECEPFITADHRVMLERAQDIADGTRIAMHILGVKRAVIGIERNKPDAIEALRAIANGFEVMALPARYPQGGEKVIIQTILGREVPSGGLPADAGCVVLNVGTTAAIADAVLRGLPLTQRVVTVTGPGIAQPANLLVRLGTPFGFAIEACGGFKQPGAVTRLISGGPMMGLVQPSAEAQCIKGTSGILALTAADFGVTRACINCGRCAAACPAHLMPMRVSRACKQGDLAPMEKLGALDCMECGSCSYSCPSKIDVLTPIRLGKRAILASRKKA